MRWFVLFAFLYLSVPTAHSGEPMKVATFEFDVTPPLGAPLCEGAVPKAQRIDDPLPQLRQVLEERHLPAGLFQTGCE